MLAILCLMLSMAVIPVSAAENDFEAYCSFCDKTVVWQPVSESSTKLTDGHYFMSVFSGLTVTSQSIAKGKTVCLFLDNKAYTANKPIVVNNGGTLNIQGPGRLIGREGSSSTTTLGAFDVKSGGTVNVRNVDFDLEYVEARAGRVQNGGFMYIAGNVNLENCTMVNGRAAVSGGQLYITSTGVLNAKDTRIESGTAPKAPCVYSAGKVIVSGNTNIDNILFEPGVAPGEMFTVDGVYTGSIKLTLPADTKAGADIGNLINSGSIADANISITSAELNVAAEGNNLVTLLPPAATIGGTAFDSLDTALATATDGQTVALHRSAGDITVNKAITIDLNGCDLNSLTATDGVTIYVSDSKTADYTISDNDYGRIGSVSGNVNGLETSAIRYMQIAEDDGISYHALRLDVSSVSLRPKEAGMYFTSNFLGDEKLAPMVDTFGIIVNLVNAPDESTLQLDGHYTTFTADQFNGDTTATSSMVTGIMKKASELSVNQRNASIPICARPYLKLQSGEVLLGETKSISLREFMETANDQVAQLEETQKNSLLDMYFRFRSIMDQWNTEDIHSAWVAREDRSFRVLAITSSFGLNTTQFFREIAIAEGMEDATIARAYASGCTLQKHVTNMYDGIGIYDYSKNSTGKWTTRYETSLEYALDDEYWDIIYIQQSAAQSPILSSYNDANGNDYIDLLMAYVAPRAANPDVKYVWNMTWAYQGDSTQKVFAETFKGDQMAMYNACVNCVKEKVVGRTDFDAIIPSGTAIQNARTSYFGDTLTKDTYHLNNLGRVIAGYTMYATLTGKTAITEINLGPVNSGDVPTMLYLDDTDRQVIIEAVNNALANPWSVTPSSFPTNP